MHYADQKGCLTVFTCNGKLLSQLSLEGPALVRGDLLPFIPCCSTCIPHLFHIPIPHSYSTFHQAIAMTEDGKHLVSGGFDCTVRVFSTHNLQLRHTHPPFNSRIRSLHITKDQRSVIIEVIDLISSLKFSISFSSQFYFCWVGIRKCVCSLHPHVGELLATTLVIN